jgi:DNA (cytosine-5)-methyltransferase 1
MEKVGEDQFRFIPGQESKYRRMSVRECARIQTFPDTHQFCYDRIIDGYKMIGNAVPVTFAFHLASQIMRTIQGVKKPSRAASAVEPKPDGRRGKTSQRARASQHSSGNSEG